MPILSRLILVCLLSILSSVTLASAALESLQVVAQENSTLVVLEFSAPVQYKHFRLSHPDRIVLDLMHTSRAPNARWNVNPGSPLTQLRSAPRENQHYRIVIDLSQPVKYELKEHALKAGRYQLLLRLPANGLNVPGVQMREASSTAASAPQLKPKPVLPRARDIVVAIDPGHGGKDPGAKGARGTLEKHVVLDISKKLAAEINREPGMRAVMTRADDRFLPLRLRMEIARKHQADLFVSVHANSYKDPKVHGSSVYTLSSRGASSEAAHWLAKKENSADLVGGVSISDKDDMVATVLLDLSQTVTNDASFAVAQELVHSMGRVNKLHKRHIEKAGFAVLKSPDIPSILVETMYLTNPSEELKLRSQRHQDTMAQAIFQGIKSYFIKHPLEGTKFAAKKHVIQRGETLYAIASQYSVSVDHIRAVNHLGNDSVRVGQVLRIPL